MYINGTSHTGKAQEVDTPDLSFIQAEHKGLGLFGKMDFTSGLDKLTARIKWDSFYPDVLNGVGNPYESVQIMVRGPLEVFEGGKKIETKQVSFVMTASSKNWPSTKFKHQDNAEMETNFSVTRSKLIIDGATIHEVDVEANILVMNGVDVLADFRNAL